MISICIAGRASAATWMTVTAGGGLADGRVDERLEGPPRRREHRSIGVGGQAAHEHREVDDVTGGPARRLHEVDDARPGLLDLGQ